MRKILILILIYSLIVILTPSCEKGDNSSENIEFSGELVKHTKCKDSEPISVREDTPDSLSCIKYIFDNNKLILKHINAGFNCCPDSLYVNTFLNKDTIVIEEYETSKLCDCNCLYDLDIELTGIEAKKYHIKFVEPYVIDKEEIFFDIDLKNSVEDRFCMIRNHYPWRN